MTSRTTAEDTERFLRTGETDPYAAACSGDRRNGYKQARHDLREALIAEVRRRTPSKLVPSLPADIVGLTRRKVEPMVRGLLPQAEQPVVLSTLERSVVFLTPSNIETLLHEEMYHHSAWILANMYLASLDLELLGPEAPQLVGYSQNTTCFVSARYFEGGNLFADFVVHEAAHIFHNCKRETLGLPFTRRREWLLEIDYRQRETFAYACEAYSRILELADSPVRRRQLAAEFSDTVRIADERADATEVAAIVCEAAMTRNGWKSILRRCRPRRAVPQ